MLEAVYVGGSTCWRQYMLEAVYVERQYRDAQYTPLEDNSNKSVLQHQACCPGYIKVAGATLKWFKPESAQAVFFRSGHLFFFN